MESISATLLTRSTEQFGDFQLYRYTPSLEAAITSVIIFAILTVLHVWRIWRAQTWYFIPFTVGGLFQVIGYCGRIASHYDLEGTGGYVMQAILILVAPTLYAASIYMILGRLSRRLGAEELSLIPVNWLSKIFVVGNVISLVMQGGGGGMQAIGTQDLFNLGEKVIVAGLWVQIAMFSIFMIISIVFHLRLRRSPPRAMRSAGIPWQRYLYVQYGASLLILIRSIFRVIEYLQGNSGYLISHEIFLYLFDAVLMAVVMAVFLVWYVDGLAPEATYHKRASDDTSDHALNTMV